MEHRKSYILILGIFFLNICFAQNFNDALRLSFPGSGSSARALGMGNSYIAQSDEFSGVYFNPAGLGLMRNFEFSGSLEHNGISNSVDFFNNSTKSSQNNTSFSNIGFVYPLPTFRGSMVFAIGYNKVKDFNKIMKFSGFNPNSTYIRDLTSVNDDLIYELYLSYPTYDADNNYTGDTTPLQNRLDQSGEITEKGDIGAWSFAGSVEMVKGLFIGATLNLYSGTYENINIYNETDSRNIYQGLTDPGDEGSLDFMLFNLRNDLKWDISGYDLKLGLIYQSTPFIRLAGTIKFPTYYKIDEKFITEGESEFRDMIVNPERYESDVKYDIKTPFVFEFGGSFIMYELTANAQFGYTDYTQMEFTDGLDRSLMNDNNLEISDLFRGAYNFNLGIEYFLINANTKLRCGFMYRQSPYAGDPAKYDRKYITGGVGFLFGKQFILDLGYAYGWWNNFGDNYSTNVSRTYQELSQSSLMITGRYSF